MAKETKAVAVKTANEVATEVIQDWGTPQFVGSSDIVIPKILPMQGLSQLVMDGKAMFGEFRDSVNGTLLGSLDKPFEVIPFHLDKVWDIKLEQADGSFKWSRTIPLIENPMDAGYNDNLTWEGEENGLKVQRIRRMNFYVMLPSEVASGEGMPYMLSFKSTSIKEGKKLFTQMYVRNLRASLPPPGYVITVAGLKQKNDKGTYAVPTISVGRKSTAAEINECLSWFKLVKKGAVKVDERDVQGETVEVDASEPTDF